MRNPRILATLTCLTALAVSAGCLAQASPAQESSLRDSPPHFEIEHLSWIGTVVEGETVSVSNPFGDLRAKFGGYEGKVEIFATAQQFPGEGAPLELEGRQLDGGGVEVSVGGEQTAPIPGHRKRVDLVVFVPHGATLRASTHNGLIQAKGLHGDVHATSEGGDLYAREVEGDLTMSTGSGDVLVVLRPRGSAHSQSAHSQSAQSQATARQVFSSKSGDVTLYASEECHLAVDLVTSGLLSTDFTTRITKAASVKRGEAQLGKALTAVSLTSETGHLRLVRLPLAQEAKGGSRR